MAVKSVIALTAIALTFPWSTHASTVFQATLTGTREYPLLVVTIENGHGSVTLDDSEREPSFDVPTSDLIDGIVTGFYFRDTLSRYAVASTVKPVSARQVSSPATVTKSVQTSAAPALRIADPTPALVMPLSLTDLLGGDFHVYLDEADVDAIDFQGGEIDDGLLAVPEPSMALLLTGIALLLIGLGSMRLYPLRKR